MTTNNSGENSQQHNPSDDSAEKPQRYDGSIGGPENKPNPAENSPAIDAHEDPDQQQEMVNALIDGTFDENIQLHAENLAEKLIERQAELDRRELQLNRMSLEIENQLRQTRLVESTEEAIADEEINEEIAEAVLAEEVESSEVNSSEVTSEAETESADGSTEETSEEQSEELLHYRVDRFISAQLAPSSRLSSRLRKYLANKKSNKSKATDGKTVDAEAESAVSAEQDETPIDSSTMSPLKNVPPIDASIVETLGIEQTNEEQTDPVLLSINNLTQSASAIRQRSEEVDAMYDQLTGVFSEMLRQQAAMRQLASQMSKSATKRDAKHIQSLHKEIDRLTIQLTLVGREHFLLPEGTEEAA